MSESYRTAFAAIYDEFMRDAPYELWFGWLKEQVPDLEHLSVADLGCGTGVFTRRLAGVCSSVFGIDLSAEMLSVAQQFAMEEQLRIGWLCQDMRQLHLPEKVHLIVSTSDSINYLPSVDDLRQALGRVFENLRPGGWVYFDLIGIRRLEELRKGFSYDLRSDAAALFESEVSEEGEITYDVHAFVSVGDGVYRRISEHHTQRYFAPETVSACLSEVGFTELEFRGDFGHSELKQAERYIVRACRPT